MQIRVGIATGLVVAGDIIGDGTFEERAVLGDAPNLAARLQELATPNGVLIAESTSRLVRSRFDLAADDRCLQYRAVFVCENGDCYPVLDRVEVALTR